MGKSSGIEWTHHTFNPWWGCVKISPACDNCYAEAWDKRCGGDHWGAHKTYRYFGEKHWREPISWDNAAKANGERPRVFSGSMCDIFDNAANPQERIKLWRLIAATPNLEWLLLTKRPQNIWAMLPDGWGNGWPNVRLGVTTENQAEADRRIPVLQQVAAKGYFISAEPLLGPLDFRKVPGFNLVDLDLSSWWVITGGESGSKKSRPSHPDWFRQLRTLCSNARVPFFFKQWGDWLPGHHYTDELQVRDPALEQSRYECAQWDGKEWDIGYTLAVDTYDEHALYRVGKKSAGRLLDGREHNEFPAPLHS